MRTRATAAVFALLVTLTACGSDSDDSSTTTPPTQETQMIADVQDSGMSLTVTDPWAKATDEDMTGVFGAFENTGDTPLHIVSVESDVAERSEIHESILVDGVSKMQEKEGGFTVEPGEIYILEPGRDHLMLMKLKEELLPGDEVVLTIATDDGQTMEIRAAVRTFSGALEDYIGDN